jgi:hypothetical protein
MKNHYRTEQIYFQFEDPPEGIVGPLAESLEGVDLKVTRGRKTGLFVVSFVLDNNLDVEKLASFIERNNIPQSKYCIWISLVTAFDSDILRVPQVAINLVKRIGGNIVFSFTCVGIDDTEDDD